jgi:hypothetical protein
VNSTQAQQLTSSSKRNPCPICGRTKDDDCRISADLVQCCYGATHSPPTGLKPGEVITGADGQQWAYTGDASGLRDRAVFTPHKPRDTTAGNSRSNSPAPFSFTLARLPQPAPLPPAHWPHGHRLPYADGLVVEVSIKAEGKAFYPKHQTTAGKWARGKGPNPWPLWQEADAIAHGRGRWIAETEGEKCAEWLRAAGLVAISQPGHDLGAASIQRRYAALAAAGVAGVAYLADHDDEGHRKASKCAAAAAAAGLRLVVINAADVWPGLPAKGSIDDAPGTAIERAAVFELAAGEALQQHQRNAQDAAAAAQPAAATNGGKRIRLAPDDVLTQLPQILGTLRQNVRTGDVMTKAGILSGNQISRLYLQLSNGGETWPKEATADAVMYLAGQNTYDPVAEYLGSITAEPLPLEQWNRLDQDLLGITDPIAARFLPRFLISAVARTLQPGCYVRQSPVLVGPQERGKSELGKILFGADHWVEGVGKLDRDALQRAHTAWGVELAELDGVTRRRDQEQLKAFLTETCDTYQIRYDKHPERHPRRFVFWGSANRPPLRDSTGSTRFVIIPVPDQMLPLDWARQNRDALWARALQQYRSGVTWLRTDEQERQEVEARNADFIERDPWADRVAALLASRMESDTLPVKVPEILQHLGVPVERQTNETAKRVSSIAELSGWRHGRRTVKGQKLQGLWPGHPGHPEDTPGGVREGASDANGSQLPDTPDTPISMERENKGDRGNRQQAGTGTEMHAGRSAPFSGCPGCPPDQIDRSARLAGVSGGVSAGVSGGVSAGVSGGPSGLKRGDLVELRQSDGSWRNGWRLADLTETTIGPRARIETTNTAGASDYRVVGVDQIRPCTGGQP